MFDFIKPGGIECMIMDSAGEADNLIEQIAKYAGMGFNADSLEMPDISDLLPEDQERVLAAYHMFLE